MDSEKKRNDKDNKNLEEEYSKIKRNASPKVLKQELKWNKKEESSFYKGYGIELRLFRKRKRKSA